MKFQFGETKKSRDTNGGYAGGYDVWLADPSRGIRYAALQQWLLRRASTFRSGDSDFAGAADDDSDVPF